MYKILLIDDEQITLDGISKVVHWHRYGTQLVGMAVNGYQGYKLIQKNPPHIVITDIKMPLMNGLELIEKVQAEFPRTKFIVLSGYGEFTYAQQAMKFGVKHYLLKPCSETHITDVLQELVAELIAQDQQAHQGTASSQTEKVSLLECAFQDEFALSRHYDVEKLAFAIRSGNEELTGRFLTEFRRGLERSGAGLEAWRAGCHMLLLEVLQLTNATGQKEPYLKLRVLYVSSSKEHIYEHTVRVTMELAQQALSAARKGQHTDIMDDILAYVESNLSNESLSLSQLSKEVFYMNADYVGKLFKQRSGENFSNYVMKARVREAMRLLHKFEEMPIAMVAEQVGFGANPQYFSKVFRKLTGTTPTEFRERRAPAEHGLLEGLE